MTNSALFCLNSLHQVKNKKVLLFTVLRAPPYLWTPVIVLKVIGSVRKPVNTQCCKEVHCFAFTLDSALTDLTHFKIGGCHVYSTEESCLYVVYMFAQGARACRSASTLSGFPYSAFLLYRDWILMLNVHWRNFPLTCLSPCLSMRPEL